MKKLFFTALLAVSFSGAMQAKNVEIKESPKKETTKILKVDCLQVAMDATDEMFCDSSASVEMQVIQERYFNEMYTKCERNIK